MSHSVLLVTLATDAATELRFGVALDDESASKIINNYNNQLSLWSFQCTSDNGIPVTVANSRLDTVFLQWGEAMPSLLFLVSVV